MAAKSDPNLVCSSKRLAELYPTLIGWPGANDSFIESRINDLPKWINGISSQALGDFSDLLIEFRNNCVVLGVTGDIWFEFQYLTSNSDYDKVQADDLVEFLRRYGLSNDQYIELEDCLSKQSLCEVKRHRMLTFFRGVCKGASPKHVKAALDYLYGNTHQPVKIPEKNSSFLYTN